MARELVSLTPDITVTSSSHPRAAAIPILAGEFAKQGVAVKIAKNVAEALSQALAVAQKTDLILITGSLFVVNIVLDRLFFHSKKLSEFFQGNPLILIYNGKIIERHLREATISHGELEAVVREHGVRNIQEVDLAVLEADGNISVLSENYSHKTVRKRKAHKVLAQNI